MDIGRVEIMGKATSFYDPEEDSAFANIFLIKYENLVYQITIKIHIQTNISNNTNY